MGMKKDVFTVFLLKHAIYIFFALGDEKQMLIHKVFSTGIVTDVTSNNPDLNSMMVATLQTTIKVTSPEDVQVIWWKSTHVVHEKYYLPIPRLVVFAAVRYGQTR